MAAPRGGWGVRPEVASLGRAGAHYHAAEAARYTATNQNTQIQRDLTVRALQLLGLQPNRPAVLADVGCGSGLSGQELSAAGHAWVGTDISEAMLQLGTGNAACHGRLCLGDMAQGLPLRSGVLDGVVSISAVQWLCSHADPPAALARLFGSMAHCLRAGGRAALQFYPEDAAQAMLLLSSALSCGLRGGLFVDYPHPTPAKKYYLCLERPASGGGSSRQADAGEAAGAGAAAANLSARCCNLAWPNIGSCTLRWVNHLEAARNSGAAAASGHAPAAATAAAAAAAAGTEQEAAAAIGARLHQEHATHGRRVVRLLRRAMTAAADGDADGSANSMASPAEQPADTAAAAGEQEQGAAGDGALGWAVEAEVVSPGLMPCGGSLMVLATLPPRCDLVASAAPGSAGEAAAPSVPPVAEPAGPQEAKQAAAAAAGAGAAARAGPAVAAAAGEAAPGSSAVAAWVASWAGSGCSVRACRLQPAKPLQQAQQGKRSAASGPQPSPEAAQQAKRSKAGEGMRAEPATQQQQQQQQEQGEQQVVPTHPEPLQAPGPQPAGKRGKQQQAKAKQPAGQHRQPPPQSAFFSYRELSTLPSTAQQAGSEGAAGPCSAGAPQQVVLGLLRQQKAPNHLIVTFHHCQQQPASGTATESSSSRGGEQLGQQEWASAAPALRTAAERIERLCGQLNGCVVGCDISKAAAQQGLQSSWVVFVAGGVEEGAESEARLLATARDCLLGA